MTKDYYGILGVKKEADQAEIKKAYRNLSKKHHPDVGGDEAKFKEISEAYQVLGNEQKRKEYDNPNPFGDFDGFPFGFGNMGPFGPMRRRRPSPNAPKNGGNIQVAYEAPVHIFLLGGEIKVRLTYEDSCQECAGKGGTETEPCSECGGQGVKTKVVHDRGMTMHTSSTCTACRGKGFKTTNNCSHCMGRGRVKIENKEVKVKVHPGMRDNDVVGVVGEGLSGVNGGKPGDLVVRLHMKYPDLSELSEEQKEVLRGL